MTRCDYVTGVPFVSHAWTYGNRGLVFREVGGVPFERLPFCEERAVSALVLAWGYLWRWQWAVAAMQRLREYQEVADAWDDALGTGEPRRGDDPADLWPGVDLAIEAGGIIDHEEWVP